MKPGERIREFRERKDIKQKRFAKELGVSQSYVSQIENGIRDPSREFLKKVNATFKMSVDYILTGTEVVEAPDGIWPASIGGGEIPAYGSIPAKRERRLLKNSPKRRIIDNVIKILNSENDTVTKALKANIKAFLYALRSEEFGPLEKNKDEGGIEK